MRILSYESYMKSTTFILIIEAMGFKWSDFSKVYDSLVASDIYDFKKSISSDR